MHHYRQALLRMRQGDSDRDIAAARVMGLRNGGASPPSAAGSTRRRPVRRCAAATPPGYGRTRFMRPATELFADVTPTHPQLDLLH